MKKNQSLFILLTLAAIGFLIVASLIPLGPGFIRTVANNGSPYTEWFRAYDFVFGNSTQTLTVDGYGALIAAFVMLMVAALFVLIALLMNFTSSTKFGGFMNILVAILCIVSGALYIFAKQIVGLDATYTVQWGFLIGGIAAIAAGLCAGVSGVMAMKAK